MRRLAVVIGLVVLSAAPSAFTALPAVSSFAFTTFDAPFLGAVNTEANGVNISGTVVGEYADAFGNIYHGYKRSPHGVFTAIAVPGGLGSTFAHDINEGGVIVGQYFDPAGRHCFVLNAGIFTTINVPGAVGTGCRGINDLGQIIGLYDTLGPTGRVRHGFLLSAGAFTTIDAPVVGATATVARRMNNAGQIVGRYVLNGVDHGFLLDGGTFTSIDFPGAKETIAGAINSQGQIVGIYRDASNVLFGFTRTVDTSGNLPGVPPAAIFTQIVLPGPGQNVGTVTTLEALNFSSFVTGINDRGQITGDFMGIDGHVHGFVTAPKHDFEVTGTAPAGVDQNVIIGVFEGDPVGEGTFTLTGTTGPTAGIPWGLFVFCGRFQPNLVLTTTGDQIFIELLATACQTAFPPIPFSGVLSGFYRITGGTGRFGGVSGSGFITGTVNVPTPPTLGSLTFTLEGTITRL